MEAVGSVAMWLVGYLLGVYLFTHLSFVFKWGNWHFDGRSPEVPAPLKIGFWPLTIVTYGARGFVWLLFFPAMRIYEYHTKKQNAEKIVNDWLAEESQPVGHTYFLGPRRTPVHDIRKLPANVCIYTDYHGEISGIRSLTEVELESTTPTNIDAACLHTSSTGAVMYPYRHTTTNNCQ